jgi:glycosyltransferase involved in cell wall biosynthesis
MRITHIVPGSGGTFYCENCLRDTPVVGALGERGNDVVMVPMYLPLFTDEGRDADEVPIFFGGVNAYLQQKWGLFRQTPRWVDKWFDSRWVLKQAAKRAGSTRASGLGAMTLSMLRGEEGNQAKELEHLATWLDQEAKPDVVHLSNALLLGLARRVKEATGAAIVCSLQDEAPWIDGMDDPYDRLCWDAIRERGAEVDAFVSVSHFYAELMTRKLGVGSERIRVVHIGVDVDGYPQAPLAFDPPTIGYLARMSESSGLGALVEAFARLKGDPRHADLKLCITGGKTADDDGFLQSIRQRLAAGNLAADVEFVPDFDRTRRVEFLSSLSVLSVPETEQTAFGLYVLEALASGVPVVQPRLGAFPELVEATGGGVLYAPGDETGLAEALESLLVDPERARELGRRGRAAVTENFSLERMAEGLSGVYRSVVG